MSDLPAEWRIEMLGKVTTYVRAFGPLRVCVHPRHGGGLTFMVTIDGAYVNLFADEPDPRFDTVAEAGRVADTWLVNTGFAIANAMYDARLIP